jgi:hypothetical protein
MKWHTSVACCPKLVVKFDMWLAEASRSEVCSLCSKGKIASINIVKRAAQPPLSWPGTLSLNDWKGTREKNNILTLWLDVTYLPVCDLPKTNPGVTVGHTPPLRRKEQKGGQNSGAKCTTVSAGQWWAPLGLGPWLAISMDPTDPKKGDFQSP